MSVYSTRFIACAAEVPADSPFVSATCPANTIYVVRDISLITLAVGSTHGYAAIVGTGGADYSFWAFNDSGETLNYPSFHWEGRAVVQPGEHIALFLPSGEFSAQVSGYLLSNY